MRTNELTGAALDWAIAQCEGDEVYWHEEDQELYWGFAGDMRYAPSTEWAQGGPFIQQYGIRLVHDPIDADGKYTVWSAEVFMPVGNEWERGHGTGPTPLIAALRAFVVSKWGDEVEVPEELK